MKSSSKLRCYCLAGCCLWLLFSTMVKGQTTEYQQQPQNKPTITRKQSQATELRVAAASDVRDALTALSQIYQQQQHGVTIQLVFGSSGKLQQQIIHGAPFDLYLAADLSYALPLWQQGIAGKAPVVLATGHLALVSRTGLSPASNLADLTQAQFRRIAIAEPQHAPYGDRAKQALEHSGLWQELEPKIVYGENVAKAYSLVQSGAADAALVALSLLQKPTSHTTAVPIDTQLHQPLKAALLVLQQQGRSAQHHQAVAFALYLQSAQAQALLQQYGFSAP